MLVDGVRLFVRRFGDPALPGLSHRVPPLGDLAEDDLQPDRLATTVAALIRRLGHRSADVLGFSFGGRIAMRVIDQHPALAADGP